MTMSENTYEIDKLLCFSKLNLLKTKFILNFHAILFLQKEDSTRFKYFIS